MVAGDVGLTLLLAGGLTEWLAACPPKGEGSIGLASIFLDFIGGPSSIGVVDNVLESRFPPVFLRVNKAEAAAASSPPRIELVGSDEGGGSYLLAE